MPNKAAVAKEDPEMAAKQAHAHQGPIIVKFCDMLYHVYKLMTLESGIRG